MIKLLYEFLNFNIYLCTFLGNDSFLMVKCLKLISQIGKTFSFRNKKLNTFNLILILTIASLIGTLSAILPSLLAGIGPDGESLESREGSNLGYEEIIRVNIDKYGNLSVTGSFQGPQVNPGVDLSLREYDYVWQVGLIATNINTRDYYHHYLVETLEAGGPMYDVYFNVMFFVEDSYFSLLNPDLPVLSDSEMLEAAEILKNDIERAFGIANNFTDFPNLVSDYTGLGRIILYGFNYSPQIDYDYFIQYFADHTPSGLADSFSSTRINNARSWLEWMYSNNWNFTYAIKSSTRSPYGDYDSSVECQVHLLYPQIGYSNWGNYVLNLSQVLDTPFNPLVALNESAFSTSEIDVVVENGNITSSTSSPYHVPQQRGLDHDYWLLLNASYYDTFVEGYGSIPDITVNFWYGLRNLTYILPPASPQQGNVNIQVMEVGANLTNAYGILIVGIYEEAAYDRIFDDLAYGSSRATPLEYVYLFDMGGGLFQGTWQNTYKYPNGNYYIYTFGVYSELSGLTTRDRFSGSPGGQIYEIKLVQLNNPSTIQLDVLNPQPNDVVLKTLNITVNVTSPEPISSVEYYVYNYSALMMGAMPGMEIMNGTTSFGWGLSTSS